MSISYTYLKAEKNYRYSLLQFFIIVRKMCSVLAMKSVISSVFSFYFLFLEEERKRANIKRPSLVATLGKLGSNSLRDSRSFSKQQILWLYDFVSHQHTIDTLYVILCSWDSLHAGSMYYRGIRYPLKTTIIIIQLYFHTYDDISRYLIEK